MLFSLTSFYLNLFWNSLLLLNPQPGCFSPCTQVLSSFISPASASVQVCYGHSFQHITFPYQCLTLYSLHSKINYSKLNNTNHCSSMHLLTSHTQEAFPYNHGSWHDSTSPLTAETSSQNHSALAFLPLAMLTVSLHFISINFLFAAYFLLVESHTEVWIFRVLTSSQNALFPLKSNFIERVYT